MKINPSIRFLFLLSLSLPFLTMSNARASNIYIIQTDRAYQKHVVNSTVPVVAIYYSETCPHCQNYESEIETASDRYSDSELTFVKINTAYISTGARSDHVPETQLIQNNRRVYDHIGEMRSRDLVNAISDTLSISPTP